MKRLLALAALALAASACATIDTNTNKGAGNTNANANATAASPTPAGPTQADIETRERAIYEALKAKNLDAFAEMMADDIVIVGPDGAHDKKSTVELLKKYDLTEYTLSDVRFLKIDADLAIITYATAEKSTLDGKPLPNKPARGSSAWVNRGGKWVVAYHQESESVEPPADSPAPAPTASPAASPATAASPAVPASATDAEKAVWDAIKAKDADRFASFLLPEALEVEPEGVFDKAASTKMLAMIDGSKWTISDFKETKLNSDATLVTYKAASSERGKSVEMHNSSIWTNRGGQWKAVFHHGTYAEKR